MNEKMGRKGNWFNAVKKALHPESKEKRNQEHGKSKKKWFRKKKRSEPRSPKPTDTATTTAPPPAVPPAVASPEPPRLSEADKDQIKHASNVAVPTTKATAVAPPEPVKLNEVDKEQTKHAHNLVLATAKAAEAAVTAAQAAAEVVRLTANASRFAGKSKEELAAIKIQTTFRGYMARRTLRALRGLMRLKAVMRGQVVKRQTTNTLKCMQTLARVQVQIRERRLRRTEDNEAHRKKIQQKYEKDQAKIIEKSEQNGDGWDSSRKTREQIEAKLQSKHEAAIRRERTMAYAYSHQQPWKPATRPGSMLYVDLNNSHWGWSWLERWLAARPWETATIPEKDFSNHNSPRAKASETSISGTEKPSPTSVPKKQPCSTNGRLSTSSAPSKAFSSAGTKLRSPSPRASPMASPRGGTWGPDDDTRSMLSLQSEQSRRNSVTASVIGDDESLASGRTAPSYMAATESAKAKSRETKRDKSVTSDRLSVSSAKKRLSYSPSPVRSRPSTSSIPEANSFCDQHTL